jgi:hypothetical protein
MLMASQFLLTHTNLLSPFLPDMQEKVAAKLEEISFNEQAKNSAHFKHIK